MTYLFTLKELGYTGNIQVIFGFNHPNLTIYHFMDSNFYFFN